MIEHVLCCSPNFKIQLVSVRKSLPERDSLFNSCPMDPSSVARSLDCLEPPRAQAAAAWARVGAPAKAGDDRRLHPGCAAGANPTARPAAPSMQSRASGRARRPPCAIPLCVSNSLRAPAPRLDTEAGGELQEWRRGRTRLCPVRASAAEQRICAGMLHGSIVHADGAARRPLSHIATCRRCPLLRGHVHAPGAPAA